MKRYMMIVPLLLLAGCTEETTVEDTTVTKKPAEQVVVQQEQAQPLEQQQAVTEAPTEQQQAKKEAVTEPLQFEQTKQTTETGTLYSNMLLNMTAPNVMSYTAQVAVNEKMEWQELGHPMTQIVTLGATIHAQQGEVQKRLLTGEYIQEMNDIREQQTVSAYEELTDEYAAYFNEGTQWYRTDPTTMKEQIAVGFYIESIDMLLSYFEQAANQLTLVTQHQNTETYELKLSNEAVKPVMKKLLQRDDYEVLAPFTNVDNTITFVIETGEKSMLNQLSIELSATTAAGNIAHESTLTFTAINEARTISAPFNVEDAIVFDVQ